MSSVGPVTVEARVRVLSATHPYPWNFGLVAQVTNGGKGYVGLYTDGVAVLVDDIVASKHVVDMTSFHVLRIAMSGGDVRSYSIAVDGTEIFAGTTSVGATNRVGFGSLYSSLSEWDYVAYSKEYLPVPEPTSLLALSAGLAGMAGVMMRKRER